jgi:putative endonuclease
VGDLQQLGNRGEEMAVAYLRRRGYRILERNYRTRMGEIDVIAKREAVLVFVEVKTGRSCSFGPPQDRVNHRKRAHLIRAASAYMMDKENGESHCRFDVIAIMVDGKKARLTHIVDAFSA